MATDHIGRWRPKHRREHANHARNLCRWYWVWKQLRVQQSCRPNYSTVPPHGEWRIDSGYCLDNPSKGL